MLLELGADDDSDFDVLFLTEDAKSKKLEEAISLRKQALEILDDQPKNLRSRFETKRNEAEKKKQFKDFQSPPNSVLWPEGT